MGSKKLLVLSASVILLIASHSSAEITEIIDSTGDGLGNTLNEAFGVAVDSSGNVYVTGRFSDNAFKISAPAVPALGALGLTLLGSLLALASWQKLRR